MLSVGADRRTWQETCHAVWKHSPERSVGAAQKPFVLVQTGECMMLQYKAGVAENRSLPPLRLMLALSGYSLRPTAELLTE